MRTLGLLVVAASGLLAQSRISGPIVGWVWDPASSSVRAIEGIPGSALLGRTLDLDLPVAAAAIASTQEHLIALEAETRAPYLVRLGAEGAAARRIENAPSGIERVVMSPRGTSAVLLFSGGLGIVSRLPVEARLVRTIDLSAEGLPEELAVSDDGEAVLVRFASRGLVLIDAAGNRWPVFFEGEIRSFSFLDDSYDVLLAAANGLWRLRDVVHSAEARLVWEGDAAAAAIAADVRRALVLERPSASLHLVDLESGSVSPLPCSCRPATVVRLADSVFRLNDVSSTPLWLADLGQTEARTVFVPAEQKAGE